ncbi:MAG: hypothetical protein HQM13_17855 [SAR324 cluster bacterium]|nr:hypothetical protein [SAR324 cluster bacterium]
MTLKESISSIVKTALPDADNTAIENIINDLNALLDKKFEEGTKIIAHQYLQRINRCCEPGSEMDRRLQGELGDMEKVLIANLSSLR